MNIYGLLMRPSSTTLKDNEKVMRSSKCFTDADFLKKYTYHISANQIIAESAKIFILKNYRKIKDWSGLKVDILDNTGKLTRYYTYDDKGWNMKLAYIRKMMARDKKNQNPVKKISKVVLDPSDGDFSLTINTRDHLWIDDGSVITIADYIEKKLSKK